MLLQVTPATQTTILVEHRQGHVVKMEDGQAKNQPARVSFMNGQRGTNNLLFSKSLLKINEKIKMKRKEHR